MTNEELRAVRRDAERQAALDEVMEHDPDARERADAQEAELNRRLNPATHTEGPWKISPDQYHEDELTVVGGESGDAVICTVWPMGDDDFGRQEQAVNRLLITAAPDLYEALIALMGTCCHLKKWERQWPNVVKACRAAVAKAEGR
jgi:hypothetical protein